MIQDKMEFSMYYMNRFFYLCGLLLLVSGCTGTKNNNWFDEYGTLETSTPTQMLYGDVSQYQADGQSEQSHNMAVLLPLSGKNQAIGDTIRTSIETAVLQNAPDNLSVSFFDTASDANTAITQALATTPEVIIGPLFSNDTRILREVKPESLPVLSFTSDATSIGNGVMTMALMPTNSVEIIMQEMVQDGITNLLILAPDTHTGKMMAGTARSLATLYDIPVSGLYYYKEKNSDSIKNVTMTVSMYETRTTVNNKAREILSDILTKETLTAIEKSSLNMQLDKLSKSETLGKVPYNGILFLGSGDDTETLASFLRYYGVNQRDVNFYGTALWEGSDIINDFSMSGAKFAVLPPTAEEYVNLYERVAEQKPNRLASFGYDATNLAIGMVYSDKTPASYLLDPSGYIGTSGLFRLKPSGVSERAMQVVRLNGSDTPEVIKESTTNFLVPVYNLEQNQVSPARAMELESPGINPMNFIRIPERYTSKYMSRSYGVHITKSEPVVSEPVPVITVPADETTAIISPEFKPVSLESVTRTYIDSVEIEE